MSENRLENDATDYLTTVLGGAVGLIPIVGGPVSELVKFIIPNQREDRIVKFIKELDEEIKKLNISIDEIKEKFADAKYGIFLYECCKSTVNEMYEEKINYYKKLFITGVVSDSSNILKASNILKILSNISYVEILYLKFYYCIEWGKVEEIHKIKKQLGTEYLKPNYMMGMDANQRDEETFKQIIINNLFQNNLLENKYEKSGKSSIKITMVGKLLLKEIGEIEYE